MNKPYVKQFNENGECLNEITLDKPFNNVSKENRQQRNEEDKYIILTHPATGEFVGKIKVGGNNRKPCKRTGMPRNYN